MNLLGTTKSFVWFESGYVHEAYVKKTDNTYLTLRRDRGEYKITANTYAFAILEQKPTRPCGWRVQLLLLDGGLNRPWIRVQWNSE